MTPPHPKSSKVITLSSRAPSSDKQRVVDDKGNGVSWGVIGFLYISTVSSTVQYTCCMMPNQLLLVGGLRSPPRTDVWSGCIASQNRHQSFFYRLRHFFSIRLWRHLSSPQSNRAVAENSTGWVQKAWHASQYLFELIVMAWLNDSYNCKGRRCNGVHTLWQNICAYENDNGTIEQRHIPTFGIIRDLLYISLAIWHKRSNV